ncbi:hypothetical protein GWI33_021731 [Rhynchophorus ferrugineus]|uniref:Uncharacterized protein n=1 Tax=Rhynchophorus ferrugineus TaxID=354439 RepID=A0A834ITG4_RHYFE|nr:hypothetical protein GWI33_021731 [Rhynchophorus ferrugineus]
MESGLGRDSVTSEAVMSELHHRLHGDNTEDREKSENGKKIEFVPSKPIVDADSEDSETEDDSDSSTSEDDTDTPRVKPLPPTFRPRGRMFTQAVTSMSTTVPDGANNFMIDVPECWGIAPDGSMMDLFSKIELKDK